MTDLTTEQIAEWADNEEARELWGQYVASAVSRAGDGTDCITDKARLYAHARHLLLEAENVRLREAAGHLLLDLGRPEHHTLPFVVNAVSIENIEALEQALQGSDE